MNTIIQQKQSKLAHTKSLIIEQTRQRLLSKGQKTESQFIEALKAKESKVKARVKKGNHFLDRYRQLVTELQQKSLNLKLKKYEIETQNCTFRPATRSRKDLVNHSRTRSQKYSPDVISGHVKSSPLKTEDRLINEPKKPHQ